jgi:hypothetical protein
MVKEPAFVVVTLLLKEKAVPLRLIPRTFVVVKGELKVVVPVPEDWTKLATFIAAVAVTLLAFVIVNVLRG